MQYTVVGLFDSRTEAESVRVDLFSLGLRNDDIRLADADKSGASIDTMSATTLADAHKTFWQELRDWFTNDEDRGYKTDHTPRGSTLLAVEVSDEMTGRAEAVLREHHAVQVKSRAAEWQ